ncbi:hypothetical protein D3C76_734300 [compost metagenome]
MERVEERARQRGEDRFPAEQAEQAVDERVLHVMHRRLGLVQVIAHAQFDIGVVHARQAQVDALLLCCQRTSRSRQAKLAMQAHQGALDQLRFRFAFRRLRRQLRHVVRILRAGEFFQHADLPLPRTGEGRSLVELQRSFQLAFAFQLLGEAEQQAGMARLQEGVVAGEVANLPDHLIHRQTGGELLAAAPQVQVAVEVGAMAECPGIGAERHLFVAVDAQVGEDEFGPVLPQVAEEQQTQAVAEVVDDQAVERIVEAGAPFGEAAAVLGVMGQQFGQVAFLQRAGRQLVAEACDQFVLAQQGEQRLEGQLMPVAEPAQLQQWRGGPAGTADLGIVQFAGAEVRALAHDQPHQQRLRRLLQGAEIHDEIALVVLQQRIMPFLDPVEGGQEVAQVIEVGDWRKRHHGKALSLYTVQA